MQLALLILLVVAFGSVIGWIGSSALTNWVSSRLRHVGSNALTIGIRSGVRPLRARILQVSSLSATDTEA